MIIGVLLLVLLVGEIVLAVADEDLATVSMTARLGWGGQLVLVLVTAAMVVLAVLTALAAGACAGRYRLLTKLAALLLFLGAVVRLLWPLLPNLLMQTGALSTGRFLGSSMFEPGPLRWLLDDAGWAVLIASTVLTALGLAGLVLAGPKVGATGAGAARSALRAGSGLKWSTVAVGFLFLLVLLAELAWSVLSPRTSSAGLLTAVQEGPAQLLLVVALGIVAAMGVLTLLLAAACLGRYRFLAKTASVILALGVLVRLLWPTWLDLVVRAGMRLSRLIGVDVTFTGLGGSSAVGTVYRHANLFVLGPAIVVVAIGLLLLVVAPAPRPAPADARRGDGALAGGTEPSATDPSVSDDAPEAGEAPGSTRAR